MRFTLSQPGVHTAIIGTTDPDHAAANLRAAEKGPLPEDAILKLRRVFQSAEDDANEQWVGQT